MLPNYSQAMSREKEVAFRSKTRKDDLIAALL
jgi:hypothetical protein